MSERIPFVQVDTSGAPAIDAVADGDTLTGAEEGLLIAGKDSANKAQFVKTDTDGAIAVTDNGATLSVDDGGGSLTVDGSVTITGTTIVSVSNLPTTQPISATALPLPTNAATSALQTTGNSSLSSIDTKVPALVGGKVPVDGSGVTQPVSAATLPLPTGASTTALQTTGNASLSSIDTKIPALVSGKVPVDGSGVTQPVSAASLPLPALAATSTKQPAFSTAGTPSADVLTVQGAASMTAIKVDGSGVTQPVSGALTTRGGAKGATVAADITGTAEGTDHQALDVQVYHGGNPINPTSIRALTSTDVVTAAQGTAAANSGAWPVKVTDGTNTMPTADTAGRSSFHRVTDGTNTAAVKAGAAASAGDNALVVTLSPNNPVVTRSGLKGTSPAADVTSTPSGVNHQALDVMIYDASGSLITSFGGGTVTQGTAAAVTSAWPVKVTDGTNTMPTADSAARASFHKITDGTNTMPTADAAARASFHKITDGTNTMPTGDAVGRALYQRITDGTNTAAVKTGAAGAGDSALVVALSPNTPINTNPDTTASGNIAALNDVVVVTFSGDGSAAISISGTWVGTLAFEASVDGSNYNSVQARPVNGATTAFSTTTSGAIWKIAIGGFQTLRVRASAWTSGTAAVAIRASASSSSGVLIESLPVGSNVIGYVRPTDGSGNFTPTGDSVARPIYQRITDGTNTMPTADAVGRALYARITDGTNAMPTGDAVGRAIYNRITDGTSTAVIRTATTTVATSDPALAVATAQLPTSLGTKVTSNSLAVNIASDQVVPISVGTDGLRGTLSLGSAGSVGFLSASGTTAQSFTTLQTFANGSYSLTAQIQGSIDNTNWYSLTGATISGSVSSNLVFGSVTTYLVSGYPYLRANCSSYTSGSLNLSYMLSRGSALTPVGSTPFGVVSLGDATGNVMPAADVAIRASFHRVTDGTNVAAVKPATTPALASDPALVVATISPPTATLTNVTTTTTSATLLSLDTTRRGATIANDSTGILYVKFGATATATSYTVALAPAVSGVPSYYEVLQGYTGQIDAVLSTGTGVARITVLK